jgi:4-amino-4-deoxychorismate lyase
MFPLLETIKILDGVPQNLSYHQHRFEASYYKAFKKLADIKLDQLIEVPEQYKQGLVKLRFLYNEKDCFCQYDFYKPQKIQSLKIVIADTIDYSLKWVNRKALEALVKQKDTADDILIVKNGRITDTSFTNIIFFDGQQWLTPQFPLLHGTARARLINEKKIFAEDIFLSELNRFLSYKLINAFKEFDETPVLSMDTILF